MGEASIWLEVLKDVGLPAFTAVAGWFASVWRTKQKKEKDVLDNVQQILLIQKNYIAEQAGTITETKNMNKRLEAKLDRKNKSIRQANKCKFTADGDGCPVIGSEEHFDACDEPNCETCKFKINPDDNS